MAPGVGIVFGDMLPRMESTAPPAMGLGKHATGKTIHMVSPDYPQIIPDYLTIFMSLAACNQGFFGRFLFLLRFSFLRVS